MRVFIASDYAVLEPIKGEFPYFYFGYEVTRGGQRKGIPRTANGAFKPNSRNIAS